MAKTQIITEMYRIWIEVRKRYHLSDAQVQMARELGLNPSKFGKLANEKQEPWKKPLPEFIEEIYFKRFVKKQPDGVESIEQLVLNQREKKRRARRGWIIRKVYWIKNRGIIILRVIEKPSYRISLFLGFPGSS